MNEHDYLMMTNPPACPSSFDDGVHTATIECATLDLHDRGVLVGTLGLALGGGGHQGMGGYMLENNGSPSKFCGAFIAGILHATGVGEWGKLKGTPCRVFKENGFIVAVGHLTENKWFCPREVGESFAEPKEPA
jgi:hypothetical protein